MKHIGYKCFFFFKCPLFECLQDAQLAFPSWPVATAIDNMATTNFSMISEPWGEIIFCSFWASLPASTCSRDVTCKPRLYSFLIIQSRCVIIENIWWNQETSRLWSVEMWDIRSVLLDQHRLPLCSQPLGKPHHYRWNISLKHNVEKIRRPSKQPITN